MAEATSRELALRRAKILLALAFVLSVMLVGAVAVSFNSLVPSEGSSPTAAPTAAPAPPVSTASAASLALATPSVATGVGPPPVPSATPAPEIKANAPRLPHGRPGQPLAQHSARPHVAGAAAQGATGAEQPPAPPPASTATATPEAQRAKQVDDVFAR